MLTTKGIPMRSLLRWTGPHLLWLLALMAFISWLYRIDFIEFSIPWLPISVIGTAVAFYVGFKNNQAYDRMWEARKIWGGIVNESRTWGIQVDTYLSNLFREKAISEMEMEAYKKRLIYRHISWLYAHREQLLIPTSWEHISQGGHIGKTAELYRRSFGLGLIQEELEKVDIAHYLEPEELKTLQKASNMATQIIKNQARDLAHLREVNLIDDFRHMEMTELLGKFYTLQGKNERIKKFPLPRNFANMSRYFVGIFIALLPFSMVPEMLKVGSWGVWLSVLISALIGWVYVIMEIIGDYSENPFQGMANDIPMFSLCRTLEIDLKEMLNEKDIPNPVPSKDGVLM